MSTYLKLSATNFYDAHFFKMSCLQIQVSTSLGIFPYNLDLIQSHKKGPLQL